MKNNSDNLAPIGLGLGRQNSEILFKDGIEENRKTIRNMYNKRLLISWLLQIRRTPLFQ